MNMRHNPVGRFTSAPHADARWGRLRDGLAVRVPLTATFVPEPPSAEPAIEYEVDERGGALVITRVTLTAAPDGAIGVDALRVYSLGKLAAIAAKRHAMPNTGWARSGEEPWPPSNASVMESIVAATRARANPDRERLDEVAELYRSGRVHAVVAGLHLSRSQAYRLIRLAKDQGIITEDDGA